MRASSAAPSTEPAQQARTMGRDGLSLALIDARNRTLAWLAGFEEHGLLLGPAQGQSAVGSDAMSPVPLHMAGRLAWLQEWWITRNLQRFRDPAGTPGGARLAPLDLRMDEAFGGPASHLLALQVPVTSQDARSYLEATLEQSLELLAACPQDDEALAVFRCALQMEDRANEAFAVAAQVLGVRPPEGMLREQRPRVAVEPPAIWMPAQRVSIGSSVGGFVPANEQWAHAVDLPDCEMDAEALSWERFVEFAEDGGYDRQPLWQPDGWAWVEARARRAPRYVEQLRQGVLLHRWGSLQRAAGRHAVAHVSWYEADAWCRWAGRRLPAEVEWEAAAVTASARGWRWGEVWEWVAGTARAWPRGPAMAATDPPRRVLRGASTWTAARVAHPRQRRFAVATRDDLFCGFRSCAL